MVMSLVFGCSLLAALAMNINLRREYEVFVLLLTLNG